MTKNFYRLIAECLIIAFHQTHYDNTMMKSTNETNYKVERSFPYNEIKYTMGL